MDTATTTTAVASALRLRAAEPIAEGTMAFHFDKPAGFTFRPGQAIELLLAEAGGAKESGHAFSIVSAPFEDEIVIATRMRDTPYKHALAHLAPGAVARFEGPFGSLTLHKQASRPAVLIAGGIGITPFISMLRAVAREGFARDIVLIYSNRRPEDAAFLAELTELARKHPRFRLVATMTDMANSARSWDGATQLVDAAFLRETVGSLPQPVHYVVGPPAMVEAMRATLAEAGVDDDDIRSEDFYGY